MMSRHVHAHPERAPLDALGRNLSCAYRRRFGGSEAYRAAVWRILCDRFFSQCVSPDAVVLDLGAGWGEFINGVRCGRKLAMDLNPDTPAHLGKDVTFLHQDCGSPWRLDSGSLDVVFTSNFLEHLTDKPAVERTLREARRCLRPGGRIICLGPNVRCVPGAYWDFWDHRVPLSDRSLAAVLQCLGFDIERTVERFLPYTMSMSTGRPPPLFLVRLYLLCPPVWRLIGRQFLVIGKKTASADQAPV